MASAVDALFRDVAATDWERPIKESRHRTIYRIHASTGVFFLKHDHPRSLRGRLRGLFYVKARSEYQAATRLAEAGVPVAGPVAWGGKGAESALLTREVEGVSARVKWFAEIRQIAAREQAFLADLSVFIRRFLDAGAIHPDFHLGNLIVNKRDDRYNFVLVDPYGVRLRKGVSPRRAGVWTLMVSFRDALTYAQGAAFVMACGLATEAAAAEKLWAEMIRRETADCARQWSRRRKKLLKGQSRQCLYARETAGGVWVFRLDDRGEPFIVPNTLRDAQKLMERFHIQKAPYRVTEKLWLSSFRLHFLRLAHRRPLAWFAYRGGCLLVWEKLQIDSKPLDPAVVADFRRRCLDSGVDPDRLGYRVVGVDGVPTLLDTQDPF